MSILARFAAGFVAAVVLAATAAGQSAPAGADVVDVQILAINDFHGALEPPTGSNGRIGRVEAGGVEYLASHLARLKATNENSIVVSAGDNIGGTPLLSSLFHDEASIEALNIAGLQVSAVGNHELDEGWWELYRMTNGGCHPVDGCQDGTPYEGAGFDFLAANIVVDPSRLPPEITERAGVRGAQARPLFPGYAIKEFGGVRVGFIGLTLQEAPRSILPASVRGLTFLPEAEAANKAVQALREQGVRAIVVLIHEGGRPDGGDANACVGMSGAIVGLADQMSDDIDVIVSGHTHRAYNCTIDSKLVTSAASNGRLVTDIDLRIRRADGEVVATSARNVVVTRDVPKHPAATALLAHYRPFAEKIGGRVIGSITATLTRAQNDAGESALGDVLADAMLEAGRRAEGGHAVIGFTNSGGIRADIVRPSGAPAPSPVTYAQLFEVVPFGNIVIVKTLTGEALIQTLEQQFGANSTRILQISRGFTYTYDPSRPPGQRIDRASVRIDGVPLEPSQQYRVATNDYLWTNGDGFVALSSGTDPVVVGVDVDVIADYFSRHSPIAPGRKDRIHKSKK